VAVPELFANVPTFKSSLTPYPYLTSVSPSISPPSSVIFALSCAVLTETSVAATALIAGLAAVKVTVRIGA